MAAHTRFRLMFDFYAKMFKLHPEFYAKQQKIGFFEPIKGYYFLIDIIIAPARMIVSTQES